MKVLHAPWTRLTPPQAPDGNCGLNREDGDDVDDSSNSSNVLQPLVGLEPEDVPFTPPPNTLLLTLSSLQVFLLAVVGVVLFLLVNTDIKSVFGRAEATPEVRHGLTKVEMRPGFDEPKTMFDDDDILSRHQFCFSETLFQEHDPSECKKLLYKDFMKYELVGKNVTKSERYNHLCPYMKPRYNCATNKTMEYGEKAVDWKLVLQKARGNRSETCNLWNFIHDLGGPSGIGERVAKKWCSQEGKGKSRSRINVALFGNSYLRQVVESLECSWSNDVTYSVMEKGSTYDISMAGLRQRGDAPITMEELGEMEPLPNMSISNKLCSVMDVEKFYERGLPTPRRCMGYSDDIAVKEFGGVLRIHFLFRPYAHEKLTQVIKAKWGLDPKEIDILVFNDGQEKTIMNDDHLFKTFNTSGAWQRRSIWPYQHFKRIQKRDIHRWFGASNPWITHSPDSHSCMPGAADDEANLLLYLMYSNSVI